MYSYKVRYYDFTKQHEVTTCMDATRDTVYDNARVFSYAGAATVICDSDVIAVFENGVQVRDDDYMGIMRAMQCVKRGPCQIAAVRA